jgi:pimeloyl-ACP methyl ester carboxylesterase
VKKIITTLLITTLSFLQTNAQDVWSSWSHAIPAKEYEGHRFKLQASVKAEVADDSATARIWARVDRNSGQGFFENMWKNPIRSNGWKTYTIEGKIDNDATQLVVGMLCELNGKFYFDDFKVEVEKETGKWETVFTADFEKGTDGFDAGIGVGRKVGINSFFTGTVYNDAAAKNKSFLIEAKDIINYGDNKKVGKFANVNGIKIYYEIYGEGAPLLVLHGNGGSVASASAFYGELSKKYKVIAIDNRAQGKSTDTNEPLNYDIMASDINALLDQIHVDSAFIWGQSDGAILGLLMAMDYPKKAKRVIAYGVNTLPDSSAVYGWAVTALNKTIANSKDAKEVKLYTMMRDFPNIPYEKLHTISAPCLIMGGDRDVIRPEHLVKIYQNIRNSQLCIMPGSTHGGAWENHEAFLTILNNFFTKPFRMPDTKSWFE